MLLDFNDDDSMILTFLAKHWKTPHNQPLYFHFSSFCQCIYYYTLLFISISFLYAIPEREKNYSLKSNVVASSAVVVCVFLVPEFLRFTHLFMCVCLCVFVGVFIRTPCRFRWRFPAISICLFVCFYIGEIRCVPVWQICCTVYYFLHACVHSMFRF